MSGWVKLHRTITDSFVFQNPDRLKFWIWCLCKASHKERIQNVGLQEVPLKKGQFVFGRKKAANELNMDESKIYRLLKTFEKREKIEVKSNNKFSVVTVVNWSVYQDDEQQCEQQSNNKITTNEQQSNTNKNVKNDNNDKNKDILSHFESCWKLYPNKKGKDKITLTDKKELFKYSLEQISKAINNLKTDYPDKQYQMHGRRFFKGEFKDYLDGTWEKTQNNIDTKNKFNNFDQREMPSDLNARFGMKG